MMKISVIAVLLGIALLGCKTTVQVSGENIDSAGYSGQEDVMDINSILVEEHRDTSEIFPVVNDCVLLIRMTDRECDSLESADPIAYEILSENANNYSSNAMELCQDLNINFTGTEKRYVNYIYQAQNYVIDTRLKPIAGEYIILFRKNTKPKLIPAELLDDEMLTAFFGLQSAGMEQ